jgi:hypothetical protein
MDQVYIRGKSHSVLSDAGEFNVFLESSLDDQFEDIRGVFEKEWDKRSADVTKTFIDKYSMIMRING